MSNIDNRILQMEFDGKLFDSNIESSIKTLEKLNTALKLEGIDQNLSAITSSVNKMDFSKVGESVTAVEQKFTSLTDFITKGVSDFGSRISRGISKEIDEMITNAIHSLERFSKSFTVEPIKQGFSEYELKMDSVQTIMASTGEDLATVNKYLDELNTYADKTIYSFSDMTNNIGKFTNAGVSLDTSVKAIQGISNVAALAGANANQASHAMYNFAQALSSGSVRLIDWKSIENANMATVSFKEELIKTAEDLGTLVRQGDKWVSTTTNMQGKISDAFTATTGFNDSLNHQWMTTEVLVGTLAKYSDEMDPLGQKAFEAATRVKTFSQLIDTLKEAIGSGWARTFELFIGDFEQARELFTNISNVVGGFIDQISESRNSLLEEVLGGTTKTAQETVNELTAAGETAEISTDKLEQYQKIADEVRNGDWGDGEERIRRLTEAGYDYDAVMSIVNHDILGTEINMDLFAEAIDKAAKATDSATDATNDLAEANKKTGRELLIESIANIAKSAIDIFKTLGDAWREVFPPVTAEGLKNAIITFHSFTEQLKIGTEPLEKLKNVFKGAFGAIDLFLNVGSSVIRATFGPVVAIVKTLFGALVSILSPVGSFIASIAKAARESDIFYKILHPIMNVLMSIFGFIGDIGKVIGSAVGSVFTKIGEVLGDAAQKLKLFWEALQQTSGFKALKATLTSLKMVFGVIKEKAIDRITKFFDGLKNIKIKLPKINIAELADKAGQALGKFGFKIAKVSNAIRDFFKDIKVNESNPLHKIYEFFANLSFQGIIDTVAEKLGKARDAISKFFKETGLLTKAQNLFNKAFEGFKDVAPNVLTAIWNILKNIVDALIKAKDKVIEFWNVFKESDIWKNIKATALDAFENIIKFLEGAIPKAKEIFGSIFDTVLNAAKDFKMPEIDVKGAINSLNEKLEWIKERFASVKGVIDDFFSADFSASGIAKALGELFKAGLSRNIDSFVTSLGNAKSTILDFFKRIGGALFGIDVEASEAGEATGNIGENGEEAAGIFGNIKKTVTGATDSIGDFFGSIAKGFDDIVAKIGPAVKDFGELIKNIWDGVEPYVKSLIGLKTGINISNMFLNISNFFESFAGIGKSISSTIKTVRNFIDMDLSKALKRVSKAAAHKQNAEAILFVAGALALLAASFVALSKIKPEDFDVAVKGLIAITGALVILMGAFRLFFGNSGGVGGRKLTPLETFQQTIATFGTKLSKALSKFGIAAMLISFALTIKILVGVVKDLAYIPKSDLSKGIITIGLLGLIVSGCMALMNKTGGNAKVRTALILAAFVVAIKLLAITAVELGDVQTRKLVKGVAVIAAISAVLTAAVALSSKFSKGAKTGAILVTALSVIGLIVAVVLALKTLSTIDAEALKTSATALTEVMASVAVLAGAIALVGKFGTLGGTLVTVLALLAIMAAIFFGLQEMQNWDAEKMLEQCKGITEICTGLLEISAAIALLGTVGLIGTLKGTAGLAIILTAVAGLLALCSYIDGEEHTFSRFLENGKPLLVTVAGALGEVIGAFVGGIMDGFTDVIMGTPEKIESFITKLSEVLPLAEGLSADPINNISEIFLALAGLKITEAINNIVSFFTGGMLNDMAAEQALINFARAVKSFSDELTKDGGINTQAIEDAKSAAGIVSALADCSRTGGLWQKIVGETNIEDYGKQLVPFAKGLVQFSHIIALMDTEAVDETKAAVDIVIALAEKVPTEGGLIHKILGESEPGKYGEKLIPFAEGLVGYSKVIADMNGDAVMNSRLAVETVIALSKEVPETGGWYQKIMGETNPEIFGNQLIPFATGLTAYSQIIAGMDTKAVMSTRRAVSVINELAAEIPSGKNSLWDHIFDYDAIAAFAGNLPMLAQGFVDFSTTAAKFKLDDANKIVTTFESLVNLSKVLVGITEEEYGQPIEASFDTIIGVVNRAIDAIAYPDDSRMKDDAIKSITEWAENLGHDIANALIKGISTGTNISNGSSQDTLMAMLKAVFGEEGYAANKVKPHVKNLTDAFFNSLNSFFDEQFPKFNTHSKTVFRDLLMDLREMIADRGERIITTVGHILSKIRSSINDFSPVLVDLMSRTLYQAVAAVAYYRNNFYNLGADMMRGMQRGINDHAGNVARCAAIASINALNAAKRAVNSNSPSKAFEQLGIDDMKGLANGIIKNTFEPVNAARNASEATKDAITNGLQSIGESSTVSMVDSLNSMADYINESVIEAMNTDPVITPVLDLTNVKNGNMTISQLLNGRQYMLQNGSLSYAESALASVGGANPYNTQSALMTEVQGLRYDIQRLSETSNSANVLNGIAERIDQYFPQFADKEVMLDTGEVVGALTPRVSVEMRNLVNRRR